MFYAAYYNVKRHRNQRKVASFPGKPLHIPDIFSNFAGRKSEIILDYD